MQAVQLSRIYAKFLCLNFLCLNSVAYIEGLVSIALFVTFFIHSRHRCSQRIASDSNACFRSIL